MNKYDDKLLRLPFDQFSRQSRAKQLIDALRKTGEMFTILDVGGYKGVTSQFHTTDEVTILDVFDLEEKNYIKGDATKMSFADNSYDFVVNFDVFEHIPREKRSKFVEECSRVAKRGVIIAAPIGTKSNAEAEVQVNEIYKSIYDKDHEWLQEHIEYKLPEPGLAKQLLQDNSLHTSNFYSNYTPSWVLMQATIIAASKFEVLGSRISEIYKQYNSLLPSDGVPESNENYREIVIGVKEEADKKQIENKVSTIFMDSVTYFNNVVKLTTGVSEAMVLSLDEQFNTNHKLQSDNINIKGEVVKLQAQVNDLQHKVKALQDRHNAIINSKTYRYGKKASRAIHKPANIAKKLKGRQ
jgi:ubiquinone/menaquinone biosynthesis C-methylase UbiE